MPHPHDIAASSSSSSSAAHDHHGQAGAQTPCQTIQKLGPNIIIPTAAFMQELKLWNSRELKQGDRLSAAIEAMPFDQTTDSTVLMRTAQAEEAACMCMPTEAELTTCVDRITIAKLLDVKTQRLIEALPTNQILKEWQKVSNPTTITFLFQCALLASILDKKPQLESLLEEKRPTKEALSLYPDADPKHRIRKTCIADPYDPDFPTPVDIGFGEDLFFVSMAEKDITVTATGFTHFIERIDMFLQHEQFKELILLLPPGHHAEVPFELTIGAKGYCLAPTEMIPALKDAEQGKSAFTIDVDINAQSAPEMIAGQLKPPMVHGENHPNFYTAEVAANGIFPLCHDSRLDPASALYKQFYSTSNKIFRVDATFYGNKEKRTPEREKGRIAFEQHVYQMLEKLPRGSRIVLLLGLDSLVQNAFQDDVREEYDGYAALWTASKFILFINEIRRACHIKGFKLLTSLEGGYKIGRLEKVMAEIYEPWEHDLTAVDKIQLVKDAGGRLCIQLLKTDKEWLLNKYKAYKEHQYFRRTLKATEELDSWKAGWVAIFKKIHTLPQQAAYPQLQEPLPGYAFVDVLNTVEALSSLAPTEHFRHSEDIFHFANMLKNQLSRLAAGPQPAPHMHGAGAADIGGGGGAAADAGRATGTGRGGDTDTEEEADDSTARAASHKAQAASAPPPKASQPKAPAAKPIERPQPPQLGPMQPQRSMDPAAAAAAAAAPGNGHRRGSRTIQTISRTTGGMHPHLQLAALARRKALEAKKAAQAAQKNFAVSITHIQLLRKSDGEICFQILAKDKQALIDIHAQYEDSSTPAIKSAMLSQLIAAWNAILARLCTQQPSQCPPAFPGNLTTGSLMKLEKWLNDAKDTTSEFITFKQTAMTHLQALKQHNQPQSLPSAPAAASISSTNGGAGSGGAGAAGGADPTTTQFAYIRNQVREKLADIERTSKQQERTLATKCREKWTKIANTQAAQLCTEDPTIQQLQAGLQTRQADLTKIAFQAASQKYHEELAKIKQVLAARAHSEKHKIYQQVNDCQEKIIQQAAQAAANKAKRDFQKALSPLFGAPAVPQAGTGSSPAMPQGRPASIAHAVQPNPAASSSNSARVRALTPAQRAAVQALTPAQRAALQQQQRAHKDTGANAKRKHPSI
jgi:hypothetical protein